MTATMSKKKTTRTSPEPKPRKIRLGQAGAVPVGRPSKKKYDVILEMLRGLKAGEGVEVPIETGEGADAPTLASRLQALVRRDYSPQPPEGHRYSIRVLTNGNVGIFLVKARKPGNDEGED